MQVILSSGGMGYAYHWARGLKQAGHLKHIITTLNITHQPDIGAGDVRRILVPELLGHVLWRLPGPNSLYTAYHIRDNLYDHLSKRYINGGDIFHVFNHFGLHAMRKAQSMGMKTVVERDSAHSVVQDEILREEHQRYGLNFPEANRRLLDKQVQEFEEADVITVPSDFVWRTMIEGGVPESKLHKVPLGFDPGRFHHIPDTKQDDVFRIVFVGVVSLRKGVPDLLDAVKMLDIPNFEVLLVGGTFPDSQTFLPRYQGLFKHLGFVPQEKLVELYNTSSVFVLPSIEDGFGMVVYEAASCGLPVIITENVGAAIRDGVDGYVVPIRDPHALADRLTRLYEDDNLRRQMGQSAYAYVQQFTWAHAIDKLLACYQSLVS